MEEQKKFQVLYDYSDVPTLKRFALCNKRVRMAMGPFGCLRGYTLVVTDSGLQEISRIDYPTRVLSYNHQTSRFQFSPSGGAYPKKMGNPYRIVTPSGEFVADEYHRVCVGGSKYLPVSELRPGDILTQYSFSHWQKYSLEVQRLLSGGAARCSEKVSNYLDHYAGLIRQYGQRLLSEASIYPSYVPLRDGAQKLLQPQADLSATVGTDDPWGRLREHIRQDQCDDQRQTGDYFFRVARQREVVQDCDAGQCGERNGWRVPVSTQPRVRTISHRIKKLFYQCFGSFASSSISNGAILSIEKLPVKELFWDMHVFGTNNYVTVDGAIHHNSGKSSACVMEIIRRGHEQKPSPDGIRRSRWAVVRNSYGQLKDTTIKTFHDWFPPKLFGEYRVTDHMYIITKFPGVHLEVLFRALDRPDQVSNLLSLELTGAWFNEVREIPKTIIEAMDGRIGRYPSGRDGGASWYGIIMDTNPPDEDSYLYKMFERVRPDNWEAFKQPSGLSVHAENTLHLPKNYYVNLAKGKDEMYKRIYIHGQYGYLISGKPVFQSFMDNVHVSREDLEPTKGLDVIVGFDFGLQPACVIGQISPLGQLRIIDELVSDGMGLRQFCTNQLLPLLQRKYFGMNVMGFGDPSGISRMPTDETTCFELLQGPEIGLRNVVPATTNALVPRIGAVEGFLNKMFQGDPGFIMSPSCHNLRKAMNGGYHYEREPKSIAEDFKPTPAKNFSSHISDALQYLCMYVGDKEANDKRWKEFSSRLKKREHRPAINVAGY
jgi:hypothetical protein